VLKQEEDVLKKFFKMSSFRASGYEVDIFLRPLTEFIQRLELYTDYNKKDQNNSIEEFLSYCVPEFQRSNNKWSSSMKIKFIENLLLGAKSTLLLYYAEEDNAKIIDGLQRITAILQFLNNEFQVFGRYYFDMLPKQFYSNVSINIKIYTFKTNFEILKFYIDMNEGITHSKEDIDKAKQYFKEKYNITYSNGYDILENLLKGADNG